MFGFGRQLATSTTVVPMGPLTPKLPEIPAWKNVTKDIWSNNELSNGKYQDCCSSPNPISKSKHHVDSLFLSEKEFLNNTQNKCIFSKKQFTMINHDDDDNDKFSEDLIKPTFILFQDENYVTIDLDRDFSFSDGLYQLKRIDDNSIDYITTTNLNGLNIHPNDLFRESWRILKEGGELCISGQFSNLRIKSIFDTNYFKLKPFYLEDIRRSLNSNGFLNYQTLSEDEICFHRSSDTTDNLKIYHKTINSFKISTMEDCLEDYGQIAIYKGTMPSQPNCFYLDNQNYFPVNQPIRVSGNTAEILLKSRYCKYFDVTEKLNHRGPFK